MSLINTEFLAEVAPDVFVDVFNKQLEYDKDFDYNIELFKIIIYTVKMDKYEFVKYIERLHLDDEYKQELYNKGLELSIMYNKLEYMKECLKLLKTINITDYMISDAIAFKGNEIVEYLIENGFYTNYEKAMRFSMDNNKMRRWLLDYNTDYNTDYAWI